MQRLLIPAGDVSTLTLADLWLKEFLTPSLTQSREDLAAWKNGPTLLPQSYKKGDMPPLGLKKIPGIFVIFLADWDKKQCCKD